MEKVLAYDHLMLTSPDIVHTTNLITEKDAVRYMRAIWPKTFRFLSDYDVLEEFISLYHAYGVETYNEKLAVFRRLTAPAQAWR